MKVLHFGAGNIGRGFIGKVLTDAKAEMIFADINQALVDQFNAQRYYTVQIVGERTQQVRVNAVSALHSMSQEALAQIAEVDLITTALGPNILAKIAPTLAAGLIARYQGKVQRPLNIIACENMLRGSTQLKPLVLGALPVEYHAWVAQQVGFVDAVVDRIVPPSSTAETDLLTVTVESFSEWIIDRGQWKGELPVISGLESTNDLMAFVERKLFTLNTGHAIAAYLGQLAGYNTIGEAIMDPQIVLNVREAMQQSGAVLIKRYGFDPQQHACYIDTILGRFKNPYLKDNVTRVGRQPMRKLGADERLVKPLLGTLEYQLPHCALLKGIAAALHYRNSDDPEAVALQHAIDNEGPMATFSAISGIAITDTRIIPQLTDLYTEFCQWNGSRQSVPDPL